MELRLWEHGPSKLLQRKEYLHKSVVVGRGRSLPLSSRADYSPERRSRSWENLLRSVNPH